MNKRYGINANDIKKGGAEMSKVAANQVEKNEIKPIKEEETKKVKSSNEKVSTSLYEKVSTSLYLDKNTMAKVEMILKLKSLKSDKNVSVSQIVNDYLEEYLNKNKDILNEFKL